MSVAIARFQRAEVDGVATVVDVETERFITHAAEWGAEQVQTVLESLAGRPANVALFDWEGPR